MTKANTGTLKAAAMNLWNVQKKKTIEDRIKAKESKTRRCHGHVSRIN
jgi:hypothetical protein